MKLLAIESNFFSTDELSLKSIEVPSIMAKVLNDNFYPQVFSQPKGDKNIQQFMFVNPNEQKQAIFLDDKISFVQTYVPGVDLDSLNFEEEFSSFLRMINNLLTVIQEVKSKNTLYNRLSFTIRLLDYDNYKENMESFKQKLMSAVEWASHEAPLNEFSLNLGFVTEINNEQVNLIMNSGAAEMEEVTSGSRMKKSCIMSFIEINTLKENGKNRLELNEALTLISSMKDLANQNINKFNLSK